MAHALALPTRPAPPTVPLLRASEIRPFAAWLDEEGIPKQGFLERAGLPSRPEEDPTRFVAGLPVRAFLADVAHREAGPELGWRVGERTDALALDPYVRALGAAETLGEATRSFCRELLWSSPTADFGLQPTEGGAWFWRRPLRGVETARDVMEQYVTMMMVRMVRAVAGPGWKPDGVRLQMQRIDPLAREMLGDPRVELSAPLTAVHLSASVLALPVDAIVLPPIRQAPDGAAPEPAEDWIGALRQALAAALPGSPGVDWGAEATGMSRRTFQRRLAERRLSWAALLAEARRNRARREIAETALSIREVARRAGYRDPANFTRAFRRWTGSTPQAFREGSMPAQAPAGEGSQPA